MKKEDMIPEQPAFCFLPIYYELKPYFELSIDEKQNQSRFTLRKCPPELIERAKKVKVKCDICGVFMSPVRHSKGAWAPAMYVTGPRADGHQLCSYGNRPKALSLWVQLDLGRRPPGGTQGSLLDEPVSL